MQIHSFIKNNYISMTFHANITYFDCYDWLIILKFIILDYFFLLQNNIEGIPQFNL